MNNDRFIELIDEADGLKDGPAKIAVLEAAIREADRLNDIESGFSTRMELVRVATFTGYREKALVAFSWCLAQTDADRERFPEDDILWEYKWILGNVTDIPTISREQINSLQDDWESRLKRLGHSLRPAWHLRWCNLMWMGEREAAKPFFEKWQTARRDWLADCVACERNSHVEWLTDWTKDDEAIEAAEPILQGKLSCQEIPHVTLATLLRPMLRLGRLDDARQCHRKGFRLVTRNRDFIESIADHLLFRACDGELSKALKPFEKHLSWAMGTKNLASRFHYYLMSAILFEKLANATNRRRKLRLPDSLPFYREDASYLPSDLADWFRTETLALADQFNRRNGNDAFSRLIASDRELAGLDAPE